MEKLLNLVEKHESLALCKNDNKALILRNCDLFNRNYM